jgi:hypothetical protein
MFLVGLIAQLPVLVSELRPRHTFITYEQLSLIGLLALAIGLVFLIASWLEVRRAFIQCRPEYLLINTASGRVAVAYQRFNTLKSVKVADIFRPNEIKGRERTYIKPLVGAVAVEALVSDFPIPEKRLKRRLSRFLLSTRDKGFIFIVPRPSDLSFEINSFTDRARSTPAESEQYLDPIERMRRQ